MLINKVTNSISAESFFGVKDQQEFMKLGFGRLIKLKAAMQKKLDFVDLGITKTYEICNLRQKVQKISDFKNKRLATLTLIDDVYKHSNNPDSLNTHTIGLVVNQNPNEYFYKSQPEVLIMDSMGGNYPKSKEIHKSLIENFILKEIPNAKISITQTPQQFDGSLTCLNWTLANLKAAKENMGRADIINHLPKSNQLSSILEDQRKVLETEYPASKTTNV